MAKLYPPIIEGTLPAFYSDTIENVENGGMVEITIPFSMNKAVSISEVKGFSLKIKTVSSNTYLLSLKILENSNNIADIILNNYDNLFLSNNEFKSAELIKWKILQQLNNYCLDRNSLNNLTQIIQTHYSSFLEIKLSQEEIIFYNNCINKNQKEINTSSNENDIARLNAEIANFEKEIENLNNKINYLREFLRPLLKSAISSIKSIINDNQVSFCIKADHSLIQDDIFCSGQHYKMQLAYIDNNNEVGYYSTVGISKFTTKPILYIADLKVNETNNYRINFTGFYDQTDKDITEKVYNYQFNLYQNGKLYLTSGWLLHNSTYDDNPNLSFDTYGFETSIISNLKYQLEYKVRTINNLEIATDLYDIVQQEVLLPECDIEIKPVLNFNNAYIDLYLTTNKDLANGAFSISRTDSTSNYSNWVLLMNLSLSNEVLKDKYIYRDYSIEHGITYIYAIQQYNSKGLFSRHIKAEPIFADFEDAFLYDGEKQLKIKYNPKISSFKQNLLENKTDMIGSKYPFIFKNPKVSYKEFPISGLISYHSDEENLFLSGNDINLIENSVNLTGENIASERLFKMKTLDWLTNGKPKLFKSPSEGNFIVYLMNTSLTPIDTLNRMLHTFNCTAYEIADFNFNNCKQHGFIKVDNLQSKTKIFKTINLSSYNTNDFSNPPSINPDYDIYSIEFNTDPNTHFYINGLEYFTDSEGYFKLEVDDVIFKAGSVTLASGVTYNGTVTYSYYGALEEGFSNINSIEINEVALRQIRGVKNILNELQNLKTEILVINYLKAYSLTDKRYYITIDGKVRDFIGLEGIEITNIVEPKKIIVSSNDLIIECGYQYCNKNYNVELNLSSTVKNNYENNKNVLSISNYKKMIEDQSQSNRNNIKQMYNELTQLQSDYLNGIISTEEEYNLQYNEIVNGYINQEQNKIERNYINEIKTSRKTYFTDLNNYLNLVNNKLNEEMI